MQLFEALLTTDLQTRPSPSVSAREKRLRQMSSLHSEPRPGGATSPVEVIMLLLLRASGHISLWIASHCSNLSRVTCCCVTISRCHAGQRPSSLHVGQLSTDPGIAVSQSAPVDSVQSIVYSG